MRSLSSSVFRWPDLEAVDRALHEWAAAVIAQRNDGVLRIGYFGSYARGKWGVGSDLDLAIVVDRSDEPFERRAIGWDTSSLPVPTDLLVYTASEWEAMATTSAFVRTIAREAVWVYDAKDRQSGTRLS